MTESEAIKNVTAYVYMECENMPKQVIQALDIMKDATKKQIPKKPMFNGANWYRCANGCEIHKKQFEKDWYCPNCGQKLNLGVMKNE